MVVILELRPTFVTVPQFNFCLSTVILLHCGSRSQPYLVTHESSLNVCRFWASSSAATSWPTSVLPYQQNVASLASSCVRKVICVYVLLCVGACKSCSEEIIHCTSIPCYCKSAQLYSKSSVECVSIPASIQKFNRMQVYNSFTTPIYHRCIC